MRKGLFSGAVAALGVAIVLAGGAAPASAAVTKLCKFNEGVCKAENTLAAGTLIKSESVNTKFLIEPTVEGVLRKVEVTCAKAFLNAKTGAKEGEPLPAVVETMPFENCVWNGKACTVSPRGLPFGAKFAATGGGSGSFKPNVTFDITCKGGEFPLACRYEGFEAPMKAVGGIPAALEAAGIILTRVIKGVGEEEFNCPTVATWSSRYTVQEPKSLFFTN